MELFAATGKLKKFFFLTTRDVNFNNVVVNVLTRVWQELEYRIDVWRVTHGAHIKQL